MPEARSLRRLSPNCGPPFLPLRQNGRMLTPITCITDEDEDDGGFHWTENLVRVLARYIIGLVTSTRGTCSPRWRCLRNSAQELSCLDLHTSAPWLSVWSVTSAS